MRFFPFPWSGQRHVWWHCVSVLIKDQPTILSPKIVFFFFWSACLFLFYHFHCSYLPLQRVAYLRTHHLFWWVPCVVSMLRIFLIPWNLYIRPVLGWQEGKGKECWFENDVNHKRKVFLTLLYLMQPITMIQLYTHSLTSVFLRHKIVSFHQHVAVFLNAAEICLWSIDHSKHSYTI